MTLKIKIKQEIIEILNKQGDRTLTGFLAFDSFKELTYGDLIWMIDLPNGEDSNIVMLQDINKDCIDAFNELRKNNVIVFSPCDRFSALLEGEIYELPIPDKRMAYCEYHWQPILVSRGSNFDDTKTVL